MSNYMRAFRIGYQLADATKTFISLSEAKKIQIREGLWAGIHPEYTVNMGLTVFETKPAWTDYRDRINEQLFGGENTLELGVGTSADDVEPVQEHYFTNGAWVCEARFPIFQGGDAYVARVSVDNVDFDATFYVSIYDYHGGPS